MNTIWAAVERRPPGRRPIIREGGVPPPPKLYDFFSNASAESLSVSSVAGVALRQHGEFLASAVVPNVKLYSSLFCFENGKQKFRAQPPASGALADTCPHPALDLRVPHAGRKFLPRFSLEPK